jgi:hypothetical protein
MWKVQEKSGQLLEAEVNELEEVLTKTLFDQVKDAVDVNHACLMLVEKGFIKEGELKKEAIIKEFDRQYKIPTIRTMSIYSFLAAMWDCSEIYIQRVIRERRK